MQRYTTILFSALMIGATACQSAGDKKDNGTKDSSMVKLLTLDPGHFHAALVQKVSYPGVDTTVHVYAPDGPELQAYLNLVKQYNQRADNPTHWNEQVYTGNNFAEKMLEEKKGNVVVLSGNNRLKTDYIQRAVAAGLNVLADKPMAINSTNFTKLVEAFDGAGKKNVLLYDIMTERSEITNILQQELIHQPGLFGELTKGTEKDPAVMIESVHYFYKNVSGKPLVRPEWFFDAAQQGDAIADVGTHLVDLVQWQCFPGISLDYTKDIQIHTARVWPTPLTLSQYASITGKDAYPEYLKPDIVKDSILNTHANGEMNYTLKDIHVKIIARWDYKAAEGGDTHHEIIKGTKATLEIRQGKAENYKPVLYIMPSGSTQEDFGAAVQQAITTIAAKYPGVTAEKQGNEWKVIIPASYDVGHEAHFGQVMERYLQYIKEEKLPEWEVPNMITKYYTTTKALEIATKN
ncbi:putative oxidoreductase C-terminal domain-containing protein [Agriterribacter sp.]|uniref:putative oxidoreductase C-terminal domain-containing protein n=1 Tax=Agriterribacter sp. TaxID=2821509 RepID=UPI002B793F00|nr:putative oxidoreductase C-terminal domain-containing protein [Agriterribacter sp.]HRO46266.1 putative oxidoreductase C-terminal domain-containing protein [Agriterribacter sp.]HRQ18400.1 putative oxidoreductase C-terminal domain-containing protein [Agriterribacter sp.]